MSPKLRLLDKVDQRGRPLFELVSDYQYRLGPGSVVTVPQGYVTNFGTIPKLLSWVVSPIELREAAIVHDWLCNESFDDAEKLDSGYSRWLADAVLYEGMARLGFRWPKRFSVWAAVRIYAILSGQTYWAEKPAKIEIND